MSDDSGVCGWDHGIKDNKTIESILKDSTQAQVEAQPLPDTFIKGASAFWVLMNPQPEGDIEASYRDVDHAADIPEFLGWYAELDGEFYKQDPPHAPNDILYEREEWIFWGGALMDRGKYSINIGFRDGTQESFDLPDYEAWKKYTWDDDIHCKWQPASTMPELFARNRYTVSSVEAICPQDLTEEQCCMADWHDSEEWNGFNDNHWGWYVTLEEKK